MKIVGIVSNVMYAPTKMMEGKMCAKMMEDSDGFTKMLFHDRSKLILDIMKKDSFYRDIITEGIEELVEASKRLTLS